MSTPLVTPFEQGNGNQTTTWVDCIAWYERLATRYPHVLHFEAIGKSDAGYPIHAGIVTSDGVFERAMLRSEARPVFFNNNGIHPGEPEGIDVCMAMVRDFCTDRVRLAALGRTVFLFIPLYNVDGAVNRAATSRVNQDGPELFGFRGNSRHLDLNRDFIKCDSSATQTFNRFFTLWDPDVMVDAHTSNGADYPYTMTLIHTQADKLGGELGEFLREEMLPRLYSDMAARGWPTCPYVSPIGDSPAQGIADFLETPRFSTGYAALHHTIGFMPESHMLKPFADRYASMRALVDTVLAFTVANAERIQSMRRAARLHGRTRTHWPVHWAVDRARPSRLHFKGYQACRKPSRLGQYTRLYYDRNAPWEGEIQYLDRFMADVTVRAPSAYVLPQAWREVADRLRLSGVQMNAVEAERDTVAVYYHIVSVASRANAFEGRMFHDDVQLERRTATVTLHQGDWIVPLDQDQARYVVETLEPQGHDSFFRWGFFDSVLDKKEAYSDYVFEDHALELLRCEPPLASAFKAWKTANPALIADQNAVLDFIFGNCARYREPEWSRYPVLLLDLLASGR